MPGHPVRYRISISRTRSQSPNSTVHPYIHPFRACMHAILCVHACERVVLCIKFLCDVYVAMYAFVYGKSIGIAKLSSSRCETGYVLNVK